MLAALAERDGGDRRLPWPGPRRARRDPRRAARQTRTSSSCRAARASASRTWRRCSWPRTASWRCTASRCGRAARPAWAASDTGWSSCCRATPSRRSAPTTSSPAARFARSAGRSTAWPYRIGARHARAQDQLAHRPPRLRARAARGRAGRAALGVRRVGALVHDASRRLRDRRRRQRRLSPPAPTWTSGCMDPMDSMREQEQFLQVLDRDEAERRFRAAIDLDAARHRARRARRGARPRARRRRRLASRRAVVRSLQRRRLCRRGRGHVRRVGGSAAHASAWPTR